MNVNRFDLLVAKLRFETGADLARAMNRSAKSASRWRKRGLPASIQLRLIELAAMRGIDLSSADLRWV